MSRKQYDNSFLGLFRGIHKKVLNILTFLSLAVFVMSAIIWITDSQISDAQKKSWENIKPLISELKNSLFATVIMIFFFEIGLRQESLEEIRKLFEETQPSKYISNFYPNHDQFNSEINKNITEAPSNTNIRLLGIEREISIFKTPGYRTIKEKIESGCHFQILISHPESSVISSLEELNCETRREVLIAGLNALKKSFCEPLSDRVHTLNGSIEVRVHQDVFSPVCYYSGPGLTAVWMYLAGKESVEFPGFVVSNQELLRNTDEYFKHLWDKSQTLLLVKKDHADFNSNLIPSNSSPKSVILLSQSAVATNSSNP